MLHEQGASAMRVSHYANHRMLLTGAPEDEQEYGLTVVNGIRLLMGTKFGMEKQGQSQWGMPGYLDWAPFVINAVGHKGLAVLRETSLAANWQLVPFFLRPFPEGFVMDPARSQQGAPIPCLGESLPM